MTREEMIIEYYENGKIPFLIKLMDYMKGKEKNEFRNINGMDTNRNNTIYDDGNNTSWNSTMRKKINDERLKK